jgi:signal transduction histidine kinase
MRSRFHPHRASHHLHRLHRHSLSGKLVLLFLLMGVLFVLLVGASMGKVFRDHFKNDLQPHLVQYLEYIQKDIGIPPNRERALALARKLHVDIYIQGPQGTWSSNGRSLPFHDLDVEHRFQQNGIQYGMSRVDSHGLFSARAGDTTLYFDIPNLHPERKGRTFIPIIVLLLVLTLLYHLTRRMIRPVAVLKDGVKRFGQGELDHRIQVNSRDELGELAVSINEMADDIQQMLDAKRQLLLAISHELRSPLTRAKVSVELLEDDKQKSEIGKDLDEMEALIEELLETEKLSTHHRVLNKHRQSLNALIDNVIETHFAEMGVKIIQPDTEVMMEIDGPRIKLLLKNLIDNALRHTPEGAMPPELKVETTAEKVNIILRDHGEGIDAQHIPHLTEPFYRADPSRRRETGGYGLGLYLCRVITEAHEGTLRIDSEPGKGTTISVTLPYK